MKSVLVSWFPGFLVSQFLGFSVPQFLSFSVSQFRSFLVSWFLSCLVFQFLSFFVSQFLGFLVLLPYYQLSISCFLEVVPYPRFPRFFRRIFIICRCPSFLRNSTISKSKNLRLIKVAVFKVPIFSLFFKKSFGTVRPA